MFGFPVEHEVARPITIPAPQPIKTAPKEEGRRLLLYCPEQGGWHTGEWCDGRWLDSLTLTEELAPDCWTEVPSDAAEE